MTSPTRSQSVSSHRRVSEVALAVGGAFALSALFGNLWFGRVGIVVLAVAAFVAVRSAWHEVIWARVEAHENLLAAEKHHQELLFETRQSATIVREVLRKRNALLSETLTATQVDLAGTRTEVIERNRLIAEQIRMMSSLRGDLAAARVERDELVGHVTELIDRVERLEHHMAADSADVVTLPRRFTHVAGSDDWGTDEMPTIVDLPRYESKGSATPMWKQARA